MASILTADYAPGDSIQDGAAKALIGDISRWQSVDSCRERFRLLLAYATRLAIEIQTDI